MRIAHWIAHYTLLTWAIAWFRNKIVQDKIALTSACRQNRTNNLAPTDIVCAVLSCAILLGHPIAHRAIGHKTSDQKTLHGLLVAI